MNLKFYCYPTCSTCKKAKRFLDEHQISVEVIHIKENPPTQNELKQYHELSGANLKKMFNTSGDSYRKNNLKDTFDSLSLKEAYSLLSQDGMLIKRPILVLENTVLFGFNEALWKETLGL